MRKIIQISETETTITALCDDGTLWYMASIQDGWKTIRSDIPQYEIEDSVDISRGETFNRHVGHIRALIDIDGPVNTISAIKEACELELKDEEDEKKKARIELILEHMEKIYTEIESI